MKFKLLQHDSNQQHLVRKETFKYLTKLFQWMNVVLQTKWLSVRVQLQSLKFQIGAYFKLGIL